MNLIPLRTAVIAGTCAVALSLVALPAHAVTMIPADDTTISAPADTMPTTDPVATDDSGVSDDQGDGSGSDSADDQSDDNGSDAADDQGDDSSTDDTTPAPTEAPVVLPAEKGSPKQTFRQTVFLPKQIAKKGLHVVYSGLTPKAEYQPYFNGGQFGGELGKAKKANGKGVITFVFHPGKSFAWMTKLGATYGVGLLGLDTDLRLEQQVEVKYDSDVDLTTERHGKKVALSVSVDKANAAGEDAAWKKVTVRFQKKVGTTWVTVKTVKTNAKGDAKTSVKAGKSVWRAVVASGSTVAGTTTKGHRK